MCERLSVTDFVVLIFDRSTEVKFCVSASATTPDKKGVLANLSRRLLPVESVTPATLRSAKETRRLFGSVIGCAVSQTVPCEGLPPDVATLKARPTAILPPFVPYIVTLPKCALTAPIPGTSKGR